MKCEDIQIDLNKFIDNELSYENNLIINEHLNKCDQCLHKVKTIHKLKLQVVSLELPTLKDDFNIKLCARINKDNLRSRFSKLLPIAASIALIIPLTYFLTIKPTAEVENSFVVELLVAGNSINNDYEDFHQWTQINDLQENLACSNSKPTSHCSLDSPYNQRETNPKPLLIN